jgi:hypothetical protein
VRNTHSLHLSQEYRLNFSKTFTTFGMEIAIDTAKSRPIIKHTNQTKKHNVSININYFRVNHGGKQPQLKLLFA